MERRTAAVGDGVVGSDGSVRVPAVPPRDGRTSGGTKAARTAVFSFPAALRPNTRLPARTLFLTFFFAAVAFLQTRRAQSAVRGSPTAATAAAKIDGGALRLQQQQQQTPVSRNTTLVIVLGNLRCGEPAWATLYRHVLDVNSADLALMVGDTYSQYQNASLFERAKYLWHFDEYDDWADAIDLVNGTSWRKTLLPHVGDEGLLGGVRGKRSTGGLLMMARWFLMKQMQKDNILRKYRRFVLTRSDHYYTCRHDLTPLNSSLVWIPYGEHYGGYTDRHLVANRRDFFSVIDLITPLVQNPESFTRSKLTMNDNIEQFQTRIWHRRGILHRVRQFKRMMFVCAADNDHTRWKRMTRHRMPDTDLRIKYFREYQKAVRFSRNCTPDNLVERATWLPKMKIAKGILNKKNATERQAVVT